LGSKKFQTAFVKPARVNNLFYGLAILV